MVEGEAGDGEDVGGFVEVVVAVAVGEDFGLDVGYPGLVDVGGDLVAGGLEGELGGVDGEPAVSLLPWFLSNRRRGRLTLKPKELGL